MPPAPTRSRPLRLAASTVAWSIAGLAARPAAAPAQPVPGVYSDQQATVGEAWFRGYCVECHGPADMANDVFKAKWHGRTAFDLFERLRTSMPDGAAGSLPRQTYADLVAYMLKLNGRPAGPAPLPADSAALVRARLELMPAPLAK